MSGKRSTPTPAPAAAAPEAPAAARHVLTGLEPDNLLAFLALLGLLRALEAAPDTALGPRIHWDGLPLRPVLTLNRPMTQTEIAQTAADGCMTLAADHDFGEVSDVTFDRATARALLSEPARTGDIGRSAVLDSLCSDGATKDDQKVLPSPLVAMFGQGHQHFLSRLREVPTGVLPTKLAKLKTKPDLNTPNRIAAALFAPWRRQDETNSFRWDPQEDRRYARRFADPSSDPGLTEHGANRLAAVGLAALPGAATLRRGRLQFLNIATEMAPGTAGRFVTWPIWRRPTSLASLQALLGHPALAADPPGKDAMQSLGIAEIRRCRRIQVGKFLNFTRAETL